MGLLRTESLLTVGVSRNGGSAVSALSGGGSAVGGSRVGGSAVGRFGMGLFVGGLGVGGTKIGEAPEGPAGQCKFQAIRRAKCDPPLG